MHGLGISLQVDVDLNKNNDEENSLFILICFKPDVTKM